MGLFAGQAAPSLSQRKRGRLAEGIFEIFAVAIPGAIGGQSDIRRVRQDFILDPSRHFNRILCCGAQSDLLFV
jgi:hypothetical protein